MCHLMPVLSTCATLSNVDSMFTFLNYCKTQNIPPTLISPSCEELLFRSIWNSPSYNINNTFCMRMFWNRPMSIWWNGQNYKKGDLNTFYSNCSKACCGLLLQISKKPVSYSHTESASIPYVAATTWAALHSVGELTERNTPGQRSVINDHDIHKLYVFNLL